MKVIVIRAIRNMFVGQIELTPQPFKTELIDSKYYISSIKLTSHTKEETHFFKLVYSEKLLQEVCSVLLLEDEPDELTMKDMCNEVSNQIVGNTKVLMESVKRENIKLSIPKNEDSLTVEDIKKEPNQIIFKFNNDNNIWFLLSRETKEGM
jgi:chemotaxis protein CheY-P-specific phosphatase CheC